MLEGKGKKGTTQSPRPLWLPRKVTKVGKCARHHKESAANESTCAWAQQFVRACTVEMHFKDLQRHECAVDRSELAAHTGEHPGSNPALTTTAITPSELP